MPDPKLEDSLQIACGNAKALQKLLQEEFECLKQDNVEQLLRLQEKKVSLLSDLEKFNIKVSEFLIPGSHGPALPGGLLDTWNFIQSCMVECKNLHGRNHLLVTKRLSSIKSALSVLRSGELESSLDLYDKFGKLPSGLKPNKR